MQYLQIVLAVIEIVKYVEGLMPEKGRGAEKLAMVRALFEQAVTEAQQLWPSIESLIAAYVRLANIAGTFRK